MKVPLMKIAEMNFSEYIAILSGDTSLLEKSKMEKKIAVLESLRNAHHKEVVRSGFQLENLQRDKESNHQISGKLTQDETIYKGKLQFDKEGIKLNPIHLDGCNSADPEAIGIYLIRLSQAGFGNDSTVAALQFKKSNERDMYFFNNYNLSVKNDQHPDPLKQTFYISNKEDNITLKEAYNLMSGRAVHKELTPKEGEKYKAWIQLDFKEMDKHDNYKMKQFHQNYGYDLAATLAKHPIKELADGQDKTRLLESLQRGNRQSVTININGQEKKVFIEAAPQFKSLNFYNSNQQRLKTDRLYESNLRQQSVKQEVKKENQKQAAGDAGEGPAQQNAKKSRRNKQSIS